MKLNIDMLRDLTGAFGPSGFEEEVVAGPESEIPVRWVIRAVS